MPSPPTPERRPLNDVFFSPSYLLAEEIGPLPLSGYYEHELSQVDEDDHIHYAFVSGWSHIELGLADPVKEISYEHFEDAWNHFSYVVEAEASARHTYLNARLAKAFLPVLWQRARGEAIDPVTHMEPLYGQLCDILEERVSARCLPTSAFLLALSARPGNPDQLLFPASQRERTGHFTRGDRHALYALRHGRKVPVRIWTNHSDDRQAIKMKDLLETAGLVPSGADLHMYEDIWRQAAALMSRESRGEVLPKSSTALLDTLWECVTDTISDIASREHRFIDTTHARLTQSLGSLSVALGLTGGLFAPQHEREALIGPTFLQELHGLYGHEGSPLDLAEQLSPYYMENRVSYQAFLGNAYSTLDKGWDYIELALIGGREATGYLEDARHQFTSIVEQGDTVATKRGFQAHLGLIFEPAFYARACQKHVPDAVARKVYRDIGELIDIFLREVPDREGRVSNLSELLILAICGREEGGFAYPASPREESGQWDGPNRSPFYHDSYEIRDGVKVPFQVKYGRGRSYNPAVLKLSVRQIIGDTAVPLIHQIEGAQARRLTVDEVVMRVAAMIVREARSDILLSHKWVLDEISRVLDKRIDEFIEQNRSV